MNRKEQTAHLHSSYLPEQKKGFNSFKCILKGGSGYAESYSNMEIHLYSYSAGLLHVNDPWHYSPYQMSSYNADWAYHCPLNSYISQYKEILNLVLLNLLFGMIFLCSCIPSNHWFARAYVGYLRVMHQLLFMIFFYRCSWFTSWKNMLWPI